MAGNCKQYPEYVIDEIDQKLQNMAFDGMITCAQATQLARSLSVEPLLVGKKAERLGLKITDCQLGCFGRFKER